MKILILNAGCSSLKCQYFVDEKSVASLTVERIGEEESYTTLTYADEKVEYISTIIDHNKAIDTLFSLLKQHRIIFDVGEVDVVGHRVVHGEPHFSQPTLITQEVMEQIRSLIPLAPLHNPSNLEGIEVIASAYPSLRQVAVFDTAFHQTMPEHAARYPLPYDLYEKVMYAVTDFTVPRMPMLPKKRQAYCSSRWKNSTSLPCIWVTGQAPLPSKRAKVSTLPWD